jgi:hypothetical protein
MQEEKSESISPNGTHESSQSPLFGSPEGGLKTKTAIDSKIDIHGTSKEAPFTKFLIGAGATWTFEFLIGHGLEFMKIAKQTTNYPYLRILQEVISFPQG